MARTYRDQVYKAELVVQLLVSVVDLQPFLAHLHLPLDSHKLLHDLHHPRLGILHQPFQGILDVAQTPITIDLSGEHGIVDMGQCQVNGKLLLMPPSHAPPFGRGHAHCNCSSAIELAMVQFQILEFQPAICETLCVSKN